MSAIITKFFQIKEQLVLVIMLELLHFSIWTSLSGPVSTSLLLVHLGFFLLWQPLWRGDEKLRWYDVLILLLITYAFLFWMDWWLISAWSVVLLGMAGGRIIINSKERNIYMLTLVYLAFEILMRCTPMLFEVSISTNITEIFEVILPTMPLIILLLPGLNEEKRFQSVDFVHAIFISTLTGLLVAGTLLTMYRTQTDYISALIQSLIVIGVFLLTISWLSIPRAGFSGLSQLWSKSMLNIGTPFEGFLNGLSHLFRQKSSPEEFLFSTMEELVELPWIDGVEWNIGDITNIVGKKAKTETKLNIDKLTVCIYSYTPVSGALYFHCKLLIQLINNFYIAKMRERELTQQTHLQAVYETGARITHDIKNLLQSLHAITSIIVTDSEHDNFSISGKLLKKQLPTLTERLKLALEKLQMPESSDQESVCIKDWWNDLRQRINHKNTKFIDNISGERIIPGDFFDSVIDNLLENIRNKTQLDDKISTTISLYADEQDIILTISDTGMPVPEDKAKTISNEILPSDNGLGIGLYQVARQAESLGYLFTLKHNTDGNVCFELSKHNRSGQFDLL
jgi:signal transduction histidine kinase